MSVNRDMRMYMLQENQPVRGPSGAVKDNWVDVKRIPVAVYKNSDMVTTASARYNDCSHTGLTYCKEFEEGRYRLNIGGRVYQVIGCNTRPRLTNLQLKEVKDYA